MAQSKEDRNKKARERMAEYRKTEDYQRWRIESRERRKALEEKYRRERGCKPRAEIAEQSKRRAADRDRKQDERRMFKAQFIGPPKPREIMSAAEYQRWRYRNDCGEYQKKKRARQVGFLADCYVAQRLELPVKNIPEGLISLKREQILFARSMNKLRKQIKEVSNGE